MTIHPPHVVATDEAIGQMWERGIARFSFVPRDDGFAVVSDGNVVFESKRCDYEKLEEHYISNIKLYSPYWRENPRELPNQKFEWPFRMFAPPRFINVFIQKGKKRIDFTFYVPLDYKGLE